MNNVYYFKESLEDSFIYKTFNNSNNILTKMLECLKSSTIIDKSFIEEQYLQIKKSTISPLSQKVLDAFDDGTIEIRYSTLSNIRLPAPIPFIVRKSNGRIIASIFINAFSGLSNESLTIPTKNLYAIMESAYLAVCIQQYPLKMSRNTTLCKICMNVYTNMVMKILIKEYALSMDRPLCDKISFIVSKFFLTKLWGITNEQVAISYASAPLLNASDDDLVQINSEYNDKNINDISDLITFISGYSKRTTSLNVRYFIEKYISTYHPPAILAMDYFPYLLFVINNVLLGSFLVSQNALAEIVKNSPGMNHYYAELAKTFG